MTDERCDGTVLQLMQLAGGGGAQGNLMRLMGLGGMFGSGGAEGVEMTTRMMNAMEDNDLGLFAGAAPAPAPAPAPVALSPEIAEMLRGFEPLLRQVCTTDCVVKRYEWPHS